MDIQPMRLTGSWNMTCPPMGIVKRTRFDFALEAFAKRNALDLE